MGDGLLLFEDFSDKVGQAFVINFADAQAMSLTLTEAKPLKALPLPPNGRPPFSLIFTGEAERLLAQHLYWLEHEAMGQVELFLVPVGKSPQGFLYQALFN